MYDRRAAFEAFFKPVEGGYIFYRHRFARGISVTKVEHDQMVEAYADLNTGKALAAFMLIAVAAGLIAMFASMTLFSGGNPTLAYVLLGVIFAAVLALSWLRGRSIREPILGRKADQPRRDSREFDVAIGRANTWLKYALLPIFGLQVIILAPRAIKEQSYLDATLALFFAFAFMFFARMIYRTWHANWAERA